MLGYSVYAYDTRATIVSEGLRLRGVGYEIMPTVFFDNGEKEQFPSLDIKRIVCGVADRERRGAIQQTMC